MLRASSCCQNTQPTTGLTWMMSYESWVFCFRPSTRTNEKQLYSTHTPLVRVVFLKASNSEEKYKTVYIGVQSSIQHRSTLLNLTRLATFLLFSGVRPCSMEFYNFVSPFPMFSGVNKGVEFVCPPCSTSHNKIVFKIVGRGIMFANEKRKEHILSDFKIL